ncbi:MAG: hypothetical protein WCY41_06335 [Candidatus Micrarchaeia archaeon]
MRANMLFLSLFLLVLPALALADNGTSGTEGLLPPSVPQANGLMVINAVLVNGSVAAGMPLAITVSQGNSDATTTYRLITGRDGTVIITLDAGSYSLNAVLDDMATSGVDFASSATLTVPDGNNLTMVFYPAGSVSGIVLEDGRLVPGASLSASCASDWFDYGKMDGADAKTGEAGNFLFRALPTGTCIISASTQASAGSAQVDVGQGKISTMQLEAKPKALALSAIALALGAIAVAAAAVYLLFFSGKKRPAGAAPNAQAEKAPAGKNRKGRARAVAMKVRAPAQHAMARAAAPQKAPAFDADSEKARAVLSTLSEREAEIVRFLCSAGGKAKRSTMQHKLLIPKTSLLRNLRSLERKRIVKITPFGRNLVAELQGEMF